MESNSRIYFGIVSTWNPEKRIGFIVYNTSGPVRGERYKDLEAFFSKSQIVLDDGTKKWVTRNCPVYFQIQTIDDVGSLGRRNLAINVTNAFGTGK